ncbi:MAG: hypothetical protein GY839_04990 [candidate division Zixibacteria bacterium]|nr:hypothetical protein [candidate division Zixibacteria bacterium]
MKRIGLGVVLCLFILASSVTAQISYDETSRKQMAMTSLASMPLSFTENLGQCDSEIAYKAKTGGATFYFCRNEVAYLFVRNTDELLDDKTLNTDIGDRSDKPQYKQESMMVKARFIGANHSPEIIGVDQLDHRNNYFRGNDPSKWQKGVPNYSSILYKEIYSGIDLKYYGDGSSMKYDFIVHPGADLSQIKICYDDINDICVTPAGDLQLDTPFGTIHEAAPYIYQEVGGRQQAVSGRYRLINDSCFGFVLDDEYNPAFELVIDPELVYSTYLGGSRQEETQCIAVDDSGYAYITGFTFSDDFPIENPFQDTLNGIIDAFIAKISPSGDSLDFCTYFGGSGNEYSQGILIDESGNIYIVGMTTSLDMPIIDSVSAYRVTNAPGFVCRLGNEGNLQYSTYFGGTSYEWPYQIARDDEGNIYITGITQSDDFPSTDSSFYSGYSGGGDAYIIKFNQDATALINSAVIGSIESNDWPHDITLDSEGNVLITGQVAGDSLETTPNAIQDSFGGGTYDGFICKFNGNLTELLYSTYLGGSARDICTGGIEIDNDGNIYVAGFTASTNFPVTIGAYQEEFVGVNDGFITKINQDGSNLIFSTLLGGDDLDQVYGFAIDNEGFIYVTGPTRSSDFPIYRAFQNDFGGGTYDVFFTKLNPTGSDLVFSSFLGGSGWENSPSIALDTKSSIYISGKTTSSDFPISDSAFQTTNSDTSVFISKFAQIPYLLSTAPTQNALNVPVDTDISITFDIDMDETTINDSTFVVHARSTGMHTGIIGYDPGTKTATLNPIGDFAVGEIVVVTLTTDIQSSEGVALENFFTWIFRVEVHGGFGSFSDSYYYPAGGEPVDLFATEISGDNSLDLITANQDDTYRILTNDGSAAFSIDTTGYLIGHPEALTVADFDNDGFNDFAIAMFMDNKASVYYNNGDSTFSDGLHFDVGYRPIGILSLDVNGDGFVDLATANYGNTPDNVSVLLNNKVGGFETAVHYTTSEGSVRLDKCDLNFDGFIDLVTCNYWSDTISVLTNNGNGTFASAINFPAAGIRPRSIIAEDINADLEKDLLISNQQSGDVSVFFNDGAGMFYHDSTYLPPVSGAATGIAAGDIDADGDIDFALAKAAPGGTISIYINDGSGGFEFKDFYEVGETPTEIFIADYDNDGDIDLAVANSGSDNISILLNERSCYQYLPGDANMPVGIWPPSVIGADVTYLVNYFRAMNGPCLLDSFYASADANGDCLIIGSDVTKLVTYFRGLTSISWCPDYPPCWPTPDDLPAEEPLGWPNCE